MFDMLKDLGRAAVGTALLPVEMVVDAVTLPVRAMDGKEFRTAKRLRQIGDAVDDALDG